MTFTIVHKGSICVTDIRPFEDVGVPVSQTARSVTCGLCGMAGVLPRPELTRTYIHAWAERNGYIVTMNGDQYVVTLAPRRVPL